MAKNYDPIAAAHQMVRNALGADTFQTIRETIGTINVDDLQGEMILDRAALGALMVMEVARAIFDQPTLATNLLLRSGLDPHCITAIAAAIVIVQLHPEEGTVTT